MISGLPVCSDTSVTGRPAARSAAAVPPVESSFTPCVADSARAKSTRPVLSLTESSAVRMGTASAPEPDTAVMMCAIFV